MEECSQARALFTARNKISSVAGGPRRFPIFATSPAHASAIEEHMKRLGLLERYNKELSNLTHPKNVPSEWASPDQRCRAAIKTIRNRSRLRVASHTGSTV